MEKIIALRISYVLVEPKKTPSIIYEGIERGLFGKSIQVFLTLSSVIIFKSVVVHVPTLNVFSEVESIINS